MRARFRHEFLSLLWVEKSSLGSVTDVKKNTCDVNSELVNQSLCLFLLTEQTRHSLYSHTIVINNIQKTWPFIIPFLMLWDVPGLAFKWMGFFFLVEERIIYIYFSIFS